MLPTKVQFIWLSGFRGIFICNSIQRSDFLDIMSSLYRGPSIDASYQVSVHIAEGFQRRRLTCEKLTYETTDAKYTHSK
jgi:hypothetical protein